MRSLTESVTSDKSEQARVAAAVVVGMVVAVAAVVVPVSV
jgi:hypothetical protein